MNTMTDDQILANFSMIVSENPGDPRFARLGDVHLHKGDLRKALEVLTAGVGANPTYSTGQQILARALLKAGYLKEAMERFEIVLRIDPGNTAAMWEIAKIYFKQGRTADGIEMLRSLLTLDPFDEKAKRELRNLNVELPEENVPPVPEPEETVASSAAETLPGQPMGIETLSEPKPPTGSEIDSVERELEELLKMDISGMEGEAEPDIMSGKIEEGELLTPESSFEPGEEMGRIEEIEGIEAKQEFEVPNAEEIARTAEASLESAVSSIEENMPTFDLGSFQAEPEAVAEPEPVAPEAKMGGLDIGLTAFEMEEPPEIETPSPSVEPKHPEPEPEPDISDGLEDVFDFSPPEKAPSENEVETADETASEDLEEMDVFDFSPPEKPKSDTTSPPNMADILKPLEVEDKSDEEKSDVEAETEDMPTFDMNESSNDAEDVGEEESLPGIGGYEFTESYEKTPEPASDDEVFEFRREFQPIDETLEVDGFIGKSEFTPPDEDSEGPILNDLEFVDELEGVAPREEAEDAVVEEPQADEETEEEADEEPEMLTVTMAEIYAGQGELKRAISVYKSI
ncbi:tetratricopeptide repeat protein, partial [bacterium]|nr:tetratricopeptide repeat protein [bacterium]